MPGTFNVEKRAAAQTPSISSSEEVEAGILEDMVYQLPHIHDIQIVAIQKVWFMECTLQASTPMVGGNVPPKIGMPYWEPEPVKLAEPHCTILGPDLC